MPDFQIRLYQAPDQESVYKIAADTAFFGEPVEAFLDDRQLFCDMFIRHYLTDNEKYAWVADDGAQVAGYLLGSTQNVIYSSHWWKNILFNVLPAGFKGNYHIGRRTIHYATGMLAGYLKGEEPPVSLADYPAHLHINVRKEYRGAGLGAQLINAYLSQLRAEGVKGVYLHTTSYNQAACHLYEKLGFDLLSNRPNRYWSQWFGFSVDNRSYGLKLGQYQASHEVPAI
jgi:ribosomal protein S18 acetylase RimI-like enzyme